MKEKILKLRAMGFSYTQISKELGCSKGTISYHLGNGQKIKSANRRKSNRAKANPLTIKLYEYVSRKHTAKIKKLGVFSSKTLYKRIHWFQQGVNIMTQKLDFTVEDVINKIGECPSCYLTGQLLDLSKPSTYEFDHIIPKSRGGDNSLDNLGVCTKQANQSKRDMTPDEYINLCKQVLEHNGYHVSKISSGDRT